MVEDTVGAALVPILDRNVEASELGADLAQQLYIPQAYALEDKAGGLLDLQPREGAVVAALDDDAGTRLGGKA